MGNFSRVMVHLNAQTIIAKTEIPHDNARSSFRVYSSVVGSYGEFQRIIIDYVSHHMSETIGSYTQVEFSLDKARKFLDSSIGFDNAVHLAMSGAEGGLVRVLNEICECFKKEARMAYFTYIMDNYINPLDFDEIVDFMYEFKNRIGGYSPDSFTYIRPESMAANYKDIIWQYIESLGKYKNLWQH